MNRILVLYCLQTVVLAGLSNTIYWKIEDSPFIYGRNVTLFCNTTAVGLHKATWMKQSDVIIHQGLSFYPDKYAGKEVKDGSSLTIKNISESDLNTTYTCLSDVYSYEAVMVRSSSSFICLPQTTDITWNISGRNIVVQLNIERFFPVPTYRTLFNDEILDTNQQEMVNMQGAFYRGRINITSKSDADLCGGNLTVICMFGASYSDAIGTKYLQDCNDTILFLHRSDYSDPVFGAKGAVISISLLFVILCLMVLYHQCKNKKKFVIKASSKEVQSLKETDPQGNSHQEITEVLRNI